MNLAWWFLYVCIYTSGGAMCASVNTGGPKNCYEQSQAIDVFAKERGIKVKTGCINTSQWV